MHRSSENIRAEVINLFRRAPSISIKFNLLFKKLHLNRNQKAELRDILHDLIDEGLLLKNGKNYEMHRKTVLMEGTIINATESGYEVEIRSRTGTERITVRKKNLQTAMTGDIVQVSVIEFADRNEKEAIVEKVIERAKHRITGNLEFSKGRESYAFMIPDDRKFSKDIYISPKNLKDARPGDKIVCEITKWEYQDLSPEGKIVEILGKAGEVETEFKALIKKYGLSKAFPKPVKDEIRELIEKGALDITDEEIRNRRDLRKTVTFTIDPPDAKDFDDAVSIDVNNKGNYLLGVHIADVSYYVSEGSELDAEALRRGTSVYLMNDVVPMLPEKLSNDICSLKEDEDRLTFSVLMEIDRKGNVVNNEIFKSVIRSKKRFTYNEVQEIIDRQKGQFLKEINLMNELHKVLYKKRLDEGGLDFESQEVSVEIDPQGNIKNIKPKHRLDSMRLIEDFMLSANRCVTLFIERMEPKPPFIYRVHDKPDKKKMKELAYFVKQFGIILNPESIRSLQKMLDQARGRIEEYLINDITIRSMSKAIYSEENIGHYGLGFDQYTHFTSPIRRYPDLMVHRILTEILKRMNVKRMKHYRQVLPDICKQSTDKEINATWAEREAVKILQIQYMEKHIDQVFSGIISEVSEYGIYIELTENLIEGMVRLKDLHDDYYILDQKNYRLIGRRRKKAYRIGDKVRVRVVKADKEHKWLDFVIVS
ncbi:MAG: ribonuclease R [Ignavibacteria bacterium]